MRLTKGLPDRRVLSFIKQASIFTIKDDQIVTETQCEHGTNKIEINKWHTTNFSVFLGKRNYDPSSSI